MNEWTSIYHSQGLKFFTSIRVKKQEKSGKWVEKSYKKVQKSDTGYTNIFSSVAQGVIQTSCTSSSQTPVRIKALQYVVR